MSMRRAAAAAVAAGIPVAALAAWGRATRATRAERSAPLPGDELVPRPLVVMTRAVAIARPPSEVWPWIVQMGYPRFRAGWYAPYWLDRVVWGIRERSAERVVPELQDLAVGDRVPDSPDGSAWFTVERLDRDRALVLLSTTHPLPVYRDVRFSWVFALRPEGDGTRVVLRARIACAPAWPRPLASAFLHGLMPVGDLVEAGAMLRGLRARVERRGARRRSG